MQVPWYKNIKRRLCPAIHPWQTNLELTHQGPKWPGPPRDNHPLPRFRPWVAGPAHPRCIIHGNGYYPQPPHSRFPGTRRVYCSFHTRIYFHLSPHKHLSKLCQAALESDDGSKVVWMRQKPSSGAMSSMQPIAMSLTLDTLLSLSCFKHLIFNPTLRYPTTRICNSLPSVTKNRVTSPLSVFLKHGEIDFSIQNVLGQPKNVWGPFQAL